MENLETSWNFKMVISRPEKVMEKKVMDIFNIHMCIYAEF